MAMQKYSSKVWFNAPVYFIIRLGLAFLKEMMQVYIIVHMIKDVRYSKGQKMGNFTFDARFQQR